MQGWRRSMEDSHITNLNLGDGNAFFGVFDGHGGQEVALYVKKHYCKELVKLASYKSKQYKIALEESFQKMDELMKTEAGKKELNGLSANQGEQSYAGCTATTILITPSEIYCANAGDSRTVACKGGNCLELSHDHKPDDPEERKRIYNANGFVEDGRVNGMLALSRALGDFEYKSNPMFKPKDQAVTAHPDIKVIPLTNDVQYILLACDGLWDCMTSEEAIEHCNKKIYHGKFSKGSTKINDLKKGVEDMVDLCCASDISSSQGIGCDNITACIVEFK